MKTPQQQALYNKFFKEHSFEKLEEKVWENARNALAYYQTVVKLPHTFSNGEFVTHGDNIDMFQMGDYFAKKTAQMLKYYRKLVSEEILRKIWKLEDDINTFFIVHNCPYRTNIF